MARYWICKQGDVTLPKQNEPGLYTVRKGERVELFRTKSGGAYIQTADGTCLTILSSAAASPSGPKPQRSVSMCTSMANSPMLDFGNNRSCVSPSHYCDYYYDKPHATALNTPAAVRQSMSEDIEDDNELAVPGIEIKEEPPSPLERQSSYRDQTPTSSPQMPTLSPTAGEHQRADMTRSSSTLSGRTDEDSTSSEAGNVTPRSATSAIQDQLRKASLISPPPQLQLADEISLEVHSNSQPTLHPNILGAQTRSSGITHARSWESFQPRSHGYQGSCIMMAPSQEPPPRLAPWPKEQLETMVSYDMLQATTNLVCDMEEDCGVDGYRPLQRAPQQEFWDKAAVAQEAVLAAQGMKEAQALKDEKEEWEHEQLARPVRPYYNAFTLPDELQTSMDQTDYGATMEQAYNAFHASANETLQSFSRRLSVDERNKIYDTLWGRDDAGLPGVSHFTGYHPGGVHFAAPEQPQGQQGPSQFRSFAAKKKSSPWQFQRLAEEAARELAATRHTVVTPPAVRQAAASVANYNTGGVINHVQQGASEFNRSAMSQYAPMPPSNAFYRP